jgi:hypothetical protein
MQQTLQVHFTGHMQLVRLCMQVLLPFVRKGGSGGQPGMHQSDNASRLVSPLRTAIKAITMCASKDCRHNRKKVA